MRFVDVLRIRAFAVLYAAETQSIIGDQLARVALSILIYSRTGSTFETAGIYALTFLPAIVGGGALSGLADRYSRRVVMVWVDIIRGLLIAAMALPHLSTGAVCLLLVLAVFLGPLFTSAEVSLIAGLMPAEQYRVATGLRMITGQVAQVIGFAIGGSLVALIGSRTTLVLDALTYGLSAILVGLFARSQPNGRRRAEAQTAARAQASTRPVSLADGIRELWRNRTLRGLLCLSCLAGFFVAPEGLAAPYVAALGHGSVAVGLLLAAIPCGAVVGAVVLLRLMRPRLRAHSLAPMAALAGVPLIVCAVHPSLGVSMVLWFVSGMFTAYQIDALTNLMQLVDESWRGRAAGIIQATLLAAQGFGLIGFGVVADWLGPARSVAVAGGIGTLCALALRQGLLRAQPRHKHSDRQRKATTL